MCRGEGKNKIKNVEFTINEEPTIINHAEILTGVKKF
jgi:hypothetical protein